MCFGICHSNLMYPGSTLTSWNACACAERRKVLINLVQNTRILIRAQYVTEQQKLAETLKRTYLFVNRYTASPKYIAVHLSCATRRCVLAFELHSMQLQVIELGQEPMRAEVCKHVHVRVHCMLHALAQKLLCMVAVNYYHMHYHHVRGQHSVLYYTRRMQRIGAR